MPVCTPSPLGAGSRVNSGVGYEGIYTIYQMYDCRLAAEEVGVVAPSQHHPSVLRPNWGLLCPDGPDSEALTLCLSAATKPQESLDAQLT